MPELDLEKLMTLAGDKKVAENAGSLMGMLQEANKTLQEVQKSVNLLKNMGVFPVLVRGIGKKLEIDVETPLASDSYVQPKSDAHRVLINGINSMTDEQLTQYSKVLQDAEKQATAKKG